MPYKKSRVNNYLSIRIKSMDDNNFIEYKRIINISTSFINLKY